MDRLRRIWIAWACLYLLTGAVRAEPFTVARLQYDGGGDWYSNPSSLPRLLNEVGKRLGIETAPREADVTLSDPELFRYPYLYMNGHGNVRFTEQELEILRRYLAAGGFLHADDNYGMDASFRREISRLYPDTPLQPVPSDHLIYRIFYPLPGLPKIHEHDGLPAQGLGIWRSGRLVVFYSYQSDLGDGWEAPEVHRDPPELREAAFQMGTNLVLYALTH
jgi:uncharacterized protein DUF4159